MRAAVLVLRRPPYYGDLMGAALSRMGYAVSYAPLSNPGPGDVLVTWNRHASRDEPVRAHEKAGGTVIVVENGYFGRNFGGSEWFAMARTHHNGGGWWPDGDESRWLRLGIELQPWRTDGDEIVVLASRGMGHAMLREPPGWTVTADRPVRIRRHPGPQAQCTADDLERDLRNAWAVVTWGSTAALKALAMGVPVFHGLPQWIGAGAARPVSAMPERFLGDREPMFRRLAWAMWSREEMADGEPFRWLTSASGA